MSVTAPHTQPVSRTHRRTSPAIARSLDGAWLGRVREAVSRRRGSERKDAISPRELWQGLTNGRWSLVDRYDADARRYYVAIRNQPFAAPARALSEVEAKVVERVVTGESNKVVAFGLGIVESTVAGHLAAAIEKLGVASRMELVRLGRALAA